MKALAALRRVLGVAGIALLGIALGYAPIAAFHDDMAVVSKAGLAGAVLVLIAWLLPAPPRQTAERDDDPIEGRDARH